MPIKTLVTHDDGHASADQQQPDQTFFLELIQQMKSMQQAQNYFHQEILSLKSMIPPVQRVQNYMF